MTVRTRFAPSPTGFLHIGGARTALYCWLEARRRGGEFLLRIEDTDRERSTDAAVQAILDAMQWLDLSADHAPIFQTHRLERYKQVALELVAAGKAYYAYETKEEIEAMREAAMARGEKPRYNGFYRDRNEPYRDDPSRVIRFKNPLDGSVVWEDKVKGRVEWSNTELDDLVIFRSDGWPTYNFAVVVDDIDMGITEVIRGDDHVNNTPRQINIYHALGAKVPEFAHLPMILDKEGKKLSKRTNSVSVMEYRENGFLPHAILNYLVRLGWSHGDQEIFSREEMIKLFDVADVNKAASRFDTEKLLWLNQHYLKTDDPQTLVPEFDWHLARAGVDTSNGPAPADVIVALRDRVQTLKDMAERARVYYEPININKCTSKARSVLTTPTKLAMPIEVPEPTPPNIEALKRGQSFNKVTSPEVANSAILALAYSKFESISWTQGEIAKAIHDVANEYNLGLGKVAQPLRAAITGDVVSPSIEQTIYLPGKEEALKRINDAINFTFKEE